jgi:hypothetical protein
MSDAFVDLLSVSEPEAPDGETALRLLQAVYRNKRAPLSIRMRAAALALPFESPKLSATAILHDEHSFARALDRAIQRSHAGKVLELAAEEYPDDR